MTMSAPETDVIQGYCQPLSGSPGESINMFISTSPGKQYSVSIIEMSRNNKLVKHLGLKPGSDQDTPAAEHTPQFQTSGPVNSAAVNGCGWRKSFEVPIPNDWPSGMYTAACKIKDAGDTAYLTFIVKS